MSESAVSRNLAEVQYTLRGSELWVSPLQNWSVSDARGAFKAFLQYWESADIHAVCLDGSNLGEWDSSLLSYLLKVYDCAKRGNAVVKFHSLPESLEKLLHLATSIEKRDGSTRKADTDSFVVTIGKKTLELWKATKDIIRFVGESLIVLARFFMGKASMRSADLWVVIEECGPNALPIVSLISVLVGLILAFIGAVQFARFGAEIYVANLVGIAMTRELAAIMTGVILAGRTGAAFAAELGTMQVNEEIDAFTTFGISPMEFLVLPRMLALMIMMPLLCLYADLLGIIGGAFVSIFALDIPAAIYWDQTYNSIQMSDFLLGLIKSVVFGVLVAVSGCMRGIQSGRSSAAVGNAATSAVVTAIVLIVVTDAIFALVANIIGV